MQKVLTLVVLVVSAGVASGAAIGTVVTLPGTVPLYDTKGGAEPCIVARSINRAIHDKCMKSADALGKKGTVSALQTSLEMIQKTCGPLLAPPKECEDQDVLIGRLSAGTEVQVIRLHSLQVEVPKGYDDKDNLIRGPHPYTMVEAKVLSGKHSGKTGFINATDTYPDLFLKDAKK